MEHFSGSVPAERHANEMLEIQRAILEELKAIREHLGNDSKVVNMSPVMPINPVKRSYQKRGAK